MGYTPKATKDFIHSPADMGSYLAGLLSVMQEGTTPSTQLKFRPRSVSSSPDRQIRTLTEKERH